MHIKRLVKAKIPMNQAPFKNVPFYYYVLFPPSVKQGIILCYSSSLCLRLQIRTTKDRRAHTVVILPVDEDIGISKCSIVS